MLMARLRQTTRIENYKQYYLYHVKGIEKWKRLITRSVGEDAKTWRQDSLTCRGWGKTWA